MGSEGPGRPPGRRQQIALACVAGLALLLAGRIAVRRPPEGTPLLVAPSTPRDLSVHVAGEVLVPGLYRLRPGARWADAVQAARGPTLLADLDAVNLAQPLRDGDRVYVPRAPDPVVPGETPGRAPPPGKRPGAAPLDINTASEADLEALPGIGPVLAGRIIEHRRMHGRFQRLEDLEEVEGVGPRLLERLRPLLRVR